VLVVYTARLLKVVSVFFPYLEAPVVVLLIHTSRNLWDKLDWVASHGCVGLQA
jgi:hypothetical protein